MGDTQYKEVAMSKKPNSSRRSNKRPASGRKPSLKLTPGDVEAISDSLCWVKPPDHLP